MSHRYTGNRNEVPSEMSDRRSAAELRALSTDDLRRELYRAQDARDLFRSAMSRYQRYQHNGRGDYWKYEKLYSQASAYVTEIADLVVERGS